MRLIDADALMREYQDRVCLGVYCSECPMTDKTDGTCIIERWIYSQPTIDPIKHGKWEMKEDPYGFFSEIPVCSECGCTTKMRENIQILSELRSENGR